MEQSDENARPLENAWQGIREELLRRKPRDIAELVRAQAMFYAGARHVITIAAADPMSLPLMAMEIREYHRAVKEMLGEIIPCRPASTS